MNFQYVTLGLIAKVDQVRQYFMIEQKPQLVKRALDVAVGQCAEQADSPSGYARCVQTARSKVQAAEDRLASDCKFTDYTLQSCLKARRKESECLKKSLKSAEESIALFKASLPKQ